MPPYSIRRGTRQTASELYENATISPSATGRGLHIRWTNPSDREVPALSAFSPLEPGASPDHTVTTDQEEDDEDDEDDEDGEAEEFRRSPTACSVEIPHKPASPIVEETRHNTMDRATVTRMLTELGQWKRAAEERMRKGDQDYQRDLLSNKRANLKAKEVPNTYGPKLPVGVIGFGRTGTWIFDDLWRPDPVPSTSQLPSIQEPGEEQEVQDLLLGTGTKNDLGKGAGSRLLTPLPSFVTEDETAGMN